MGGVKEINPFFSFRMMLVLIFLSSRAGGQSEGAFFDAG
jgi:hypothetical protein